MTFYDHDSQLVPQVTAFLAPALTVGGRAVVVATPEHRAALVAELVRRGLDPVALERAGCLVLRDADATLGRFLLEGLPDRELFYAVVRDLLGGAGPGARVFGEMVALLCERGAAAAAVQLEGLWNEVLAKGGTALLCAYPLHCLQDQALTSTTGICSAHTVVHDPESYAQDTVTYRDSAVFVPVAAAVGAARRFVAGRLQAWGEPELVGDAALVLSELATNAVRHSESAFRVTLVSQGGQVQIGVEDVGSEFPEVRDPAPEALGGRGVAIVEDLSRTWGYDTTVDGKRVWAELRRS